MNRTIAAIYVFWSMVLVISGAYLLYKIFEGPYSLVNSIHQFQEVIDETSKIP